MQIKSIEQKYSIHPQLNENSTHHVATRQQKINAAERSAELKYK